MNGQRIGYIRVSSYEQNTDRQLDGIELDKTFTDHVSGKNTKRPELTRCLEYVREGDTLIVHSIDRFARSLDDLRHMVRTLIDRGVRIEFVKEGLKFSNHDDHISELVLNIMASIAQFERAIINERQREGIAIAKRKGKYIGRRPALNTAQADELRRRAAAGEKPSDLMYDFNIGKTTFYKAMKEQGDKITE